MSADAVDDLAGQGVARQLADPASVHAQPFQTDGDVRLGAADVGGELGAVFDQLAVRRREHQHRLAQTDDVYGLVFVVAPH